MRSLKPVLIDDTVFACATVIGKKVKDDKYGVIQFLIQVQNQDGDVVQQGEWSLLMLRRREDLDTLIASTLPAPKAA